MTGSNLRGGWEEGQPCPNDGNSIGSEKAAAVAMGARGCFMLQHVEPPDSGVQLSREKENSFVLGSDAFLKKIIMTDFRACH